jgi:arginine/lysine/ornithine decarboxylase
VRYLQFAREFNAAFPGFEADIHGLVEQDRNGERAYFVDCVPQS